MVPKTHWTIQDYLKHAGMRVEVRHKAVAASPNEAKHDFSRVLAHSQTNLQKASQAAGGGQRIADYLKTPVIAKVSRSGDSLFSSLQGGEPSKVSAPSTPELRQPQGPSAENRSTPSCLSAERVPRQPIQADQEALQIEERIANAAADYGLPAELIRGVIQAESNFQVRAVSPAGAQGLMQLMPATARELGVDDPFDIRQNIDGGARYLRQMLDRFDGDLKQALSAYNAGPGAVIKYDGQVPYPETRHYVRKVLLYAKR